MQNENGAAKAAPTPDEARGISARSALIFTASVEVKTLTLNGKQMTLSVFRQLPRVGLEGGIAVPGDPWGWVNYHPDPECKWLTEFNHLHVVAVDNGYLCRVLVIAPFVRVGPEYESQRTLSLEWEECVSDLPQLYIAV